MDSLDQTDIGSDTYKRPPQGPNALIEKMVCDDVLNEIFKWLVCLDSWSPRDFSRVSSRWRAIALNDSTLWNVISINERTIDRRLSARDRIITRKGRKVRVLGNAFPIIKMMLERSREQPLNIFIVFKVRDLCAPWEVFQIKSLAALLTPYVYNIRVLYIGPCGIWKHFAILLEVLADVYSPTSSISKYRGCTMTGRLSNTVLIPPHTAGRLRRFQERGYLSSRCTRRAPLSQPQAS
ncbi:hypothetical protein CPB85DRAFT_235126 [Mucidula mucida]|nr:hypothetical protein CPB85DRAFT_235126 [Mucidula mucida]